MRLHHLNCISTCPPGGRLTDGSNTSVFERGHLCCHCILAETDRGLVLIDTGLGLRDVIDPRRRIGRPFLSLVKPAFHEQMTAVRQIRRLGLDPADVRHIVLTHLDFDHAGGLDDFPQAHVHLLARERDYAASQRTWLDRQRYRPQQWSTRGRWLTYTPTEGDRWLGFDCVRALSGLPQEILLVPLPGHTHGHAGVALRGEGRWYLLAGDAYFHHREMDQLHPHCPPGLRLYQWMMEQDRHARLGNQRRLRELRHLQGDAVEVFSSHDVLEFERLSGRSARVPAVALARPIRPEDAPVRRRAAAPGGDAPSPRSAPEGSGAMPHPGARTSPRPPPEIRP